MRMRLKGRAYAAMGILCAVAWVTAARASHGPGASGGGNATISGETLRLGRFELSLREDFSKFEHFDRAGAEARAVAGGDFDTLDHGFLTTVEGAYGITDDFQVGLSIGFFHGRNFIGADREESGEVEFGTANPTGLTDLTLMGKYRLLKGMPGNLSVVAGVLLPTGKSDALLSNGERIAPTDQPGTGRFGMPVGVAYSRFITSHLTIDASAVYTVRFEKDFFKVGDRVDVGVALAYRLTDSITAFPQVSVFGELNNVYLFRDYNQGERDGNTGSETLYFTPGFRVRFTPQVALTVSPSIPIYQHVNGNQGEVEFKLSTALSFSF